MAKTLVIKGANFSANKVTTVNFVIEIPCTGISFSQDTITITGTDTATITYTLTPNDTTDEIIWESSNTDIVTVSDGVITAVGVGTCTVTATCGEYSAMATVTVNISYIPNWKYGLLTYDSTNGLIKTSSTYARILTTGTGNQATEYTIANASLMPAVKLPQNTGRIKISATSVSAFENSADSYVVWAKDESAGETSPYYIHALSDETKYNIKTNAEKTFTVPSGADSFVFGTRFASSGSAEVDPNTLAEACGLTIAFLPPVTE